MRTVALPRETSFWGRDREAVPDGVQDGVTGFVRSNLGGLIESVGRLHEIERRHCRASAAKLFSAEALVDGYLEVYARVIEQVHGRGSAEATAAAV
jgi:hypothetical protein